MSAKNTQQKKPKPAPKKPAKPAAKKPKKPAPRVSSLEPYWQFVVYRRRRNINQKAAAAFLGVAAFKVREWEGGGQDIPPSVLKRMSHGETVLRRHESCWLARMKAGQGQDVLARKLRVPIGAISDMEKGFRDCEPLAKHWRIK